MNRSILGDIVYNNFTTVHNCFLDIDTDTLFDEDHRKKLAELEQVNPTERALLQQLAVIVHICPELKESVKRFVGEDFWLKK